MAKYLSTERVYIDAANQYWSQEYVEFRIGQTYILNVKLRDNYVFAKCVWEGGHKDFETGKVYRAYSFEIIEGEGHHV